MGLDIDDLETNLRPDWDHNDKRGKSQGALRGQRVFFAKYIDTKASRNKRGRKGSASKHAAEAPINLPAISIQKRGE